MIRKIKFFIMFLILSISSLSACEECECKNLDKIIKWLQNEIDNHKEAAEFHQNSFEYFYLVGKTGQALCTIEFIKSIREEENL